MQFIKKQNSIKPSKNTIYCLIAFFIVLSIMVRFPTHNHANGTDFFYILGLANSTIEFGTAKWIIHPLSFFGLYPFSETTGLPYLISSVSLNSNTDLEITSFFVSLFFAILGILGTFLFVREISKDFATLLFSILTISLSYYYVSYTNWQIYRGGLIAFLPLFLYCLLNCYKEKIQIKFIIITLIFFIVLNTIHNLGILLFLILIVYFVSFGLLKLIKKFPISKNYILLTILFLFPIFFIISFMGFSIYSPSIDEYQESSLLKGKTTEIMILNIGMNYTGANGFLFLLFPVGLIVLLLKIKNKIEFNNLFLVLSVLVFMPFLLDKIYILIFLIPIFAIIIGIGTSKIIKLGKRKTIAILIALIIISTSFSTFLILRGGEKKGASGLYYYLDEETYTTGIFLRVYNNKAVITNDGVLSMRLYGISGKPIFPEIGPELIIYGYVDEKSMNITQREINYLKDISELKKPFSAEDGLWTGKYYSNKLGHKILDRDINDRFGKKLLNELNINFFVENQNIYEKYGNMNVAVGKTYECKFAKSVHSTKYKIYDNGFEGVWLL